MSIVVEKEFLSAREVADMLETEPYVLRFYEKELKLNIRRDEKGHRRYTKEDVDIFRKIIEMREHGLQLRAIEGVLKETPVQQTENNEGNTDIIFITDTNNSKQNTNKQEAAEIDINAEILKELKCLRSEVESLKALASRRRPAIKKR